MRTIEEMKLVIIGMGYLMEYIAPCYQALPGAPLRERAIGVTADAGAVQAKEQAAGIPVILDDNAGALRKLHPDVILFAPPPSLAESLTEQVLVPYYGELEAAGEELPLLFAFPPVPEGNYYRQKLGTGCRVANILPNMIREIAGRPSAEAGFTMVTLPENHGWKEEELAFLKAFFAPLGQVIFLTPSQVKGALAVSCSNQMLTEVLLDMEEVLKRKGNPVDLADLAQAARAYLLDKLGYVPPQPVESSAQAVPGPLFEAVKKVTFHVYQGTLNFLVGKGVDREKAEMIQRMNYDLNLRKAQLMTKPELRRATRNHATRGGVLECACISYTRSWQRQVLQQFSHFPEWTPDARWAETLEQGFADMSQAVYDHLGNLTGRQEPGVCQIEHHAVLYALLVKEAREQAGEKGQEAMTEATAQYGRERGRRMRQNALAYGDTPDAFTYLAYGEWSAAPGLMVVEEQPDREEYVTHVSRCEWCRCWENHGLLDYGKAYCTNVDVNIAHGFDPGFDLGVRSLMSAGDPVCEFGYGFVMTEDRRKELAAIKEKLGTRAQKDFNYHAAHLLVTCRRVLCEYLGQELGNDIADAALFAFTRRFGNSYTAAVLANCKEKI